MIELEPDASGGQRSELSYYVEFYPDKHVQATRFVESASSVINVDKLTKNTTYIGRVLAVYRGVPSAEATSVEWTTSDGVGESGERTGII
jgi:hypothetical protein